LPGSSGPGSLEASEKLLLSKVTWKSHFSFNGFLKSTAAGLAPTGHLIGPYGCGAVDLPNKRHVYSIPSGLVSLRTPLLSPIVYGSYRILHETSTPFLFSAAGAGT
jgi:hypothetical protein